MGGWSTVKKRRSVKVGNLTMGGGAPPIVQSMNNTLTTDVKATLNQIEALARVGCELTRLAVPDRAAADVLPEIVRNSPLPIVADIHFSADLALRSLEAGVSKLRINPGNIGGPDKLREVAVAAAARRVPIRVGVNAGSLEARIIAEEGGVTAHGLVRSALEAARLLEEVNFRDIVISLKASSPALTIAAYRELADRCDYPLHIGVTEAGFGSTGLIRSAVGIGTLLAEGIGDTLRVSLTDDPLAEVAAAWDILAALDLRRRGPTFVSCPTCGRTQVDLVRTAAEVKNALAHITEPLTIAVMGCAVNGPGEAREADFGLAGGKDFFALFSRGEVLEKVPAERAAARLIEVVNEYVAGKASDA